MSLAEVKKRVSELPYLRGKNLVNFYLRSMGENGLLKIEDFGDLSVAVDIQVARITFYTGVVEAAGNFSGCIHNEPIRPMIEDVWGQATRSLSIPSWYIDEPLWTIGSKLYSKKLCNQCPILRLCDRHFDVTFRGSNIQKA